MALLSQPGTGRDDSLLAGLSSDFGRRLALTLGVLVISRLGNFVPLPGIDPAILEAARMPHGDLFRQMVSASGGITGRVSVFSLGLMPYLSAAILVHLLALLVPWLGRQRATAAGRRRLEMYCRLLTLPLAVVQGWAIASGLISQHGVVAMPAGSFVPLAAATMTGGVFALLWLASLISARGLGHGVALLFFAAIVAHLPATAADSVEIVRQGAVPAWTLAFELGVPAAVVLLAVVLDGAERRLPVEGALVAAARPQARDRAYLPLRLNAGGVLAATIVAVILPLSVHLAGHPFERADSGALANLAALAAQFVATLLFVLLAATREGADSASQDFDVSGARLAGLPAGQSTGEVIDEVRIRLAVLLALALGLVVLVQELLRGFDVIVIYVNTASLLILAWVAVDLVAKARGRRIPAAR